MGVRTTALMEQQVQEEQDLEGCWGGLWVPTRQRDMERFTRWRGARGEAAEGPDHIMKASWAKARVECHSDCLEGTRAGSEAGSGKVSFAC